MARARMIITLITILVLTAGCTPQVTPAPAELASPITTPNAEPVSAPAQEQGAGSSATIACDKIIPPDEANLLLNRLPAILSEQSEPGTTTCTWQYTSTSGKTSQFQVQVGFGTSSVVTWENARKAEISTEPSDMAIIGIDGLGDENYTWTSKPDNQQVVYARRGTQTIILHFQTADVLFLGNESGIIDIADRIFNRLGA